MNSSASRSHPRISGACSACQKRKVKCGGQVPSCQQCVKRDINCVYQHRRFRGPGKSKQHTRSLEQRLKNLEDSLQRSNTASEDPRSLRKSSDGKHSSTAVFPDDHQPDTSQPTVSQQLLNVSNRASLGLPAISEPSLPPATEQMPHSETISTSETQALATRNRLAGFLSLPGFPSPAGLLGPMVFRAGVNGDTFKMAQFSPRYSHETTLPMLNDVVDEISEMYPLLTKSHLERIVKPHVSDDPIDESARFAISDALLAMAFQWKAANPSFGELSPLAWGYFKSAMAKSPLLLFQGTSALSYQAILIMAMFMQGSGDLHIASHLTTLAVRTSQMLDVAQFRQCTDQAPGEDGDRLRILWTLASLDIEISFRIGIPPVMTAREYLAKDLPSWDLWEDTTKVTAQSMNLSMHIIKYRAELSRIQFEIYEQLLSSAGRASPAHILSARACNLKQELETWRRSLPVVIQGQGNDQTNIDTLPLPLIILNLAFHDSMLKVMAAMDTSFFDGCMASAREMIRFMRRLPTQQFTVIWRVFAYPFSATLLLLAAVGSNPTSTDAESNLQEIRGLSEIVDTLYKNEHCDMGNILAWYSKFEAVGASMVTMQPSDQSKSARESLRWLLTPRTDYLRLAQSFMGKMTHADTAQIQQLSEIFEVGWQPRDEFGPFVPDVLKPKTHNFTFTFGS